MKNSTLKKRCSDLCWILKWILKGCHVFANTFQAIIPICHTAFHKPVSVAWTKSYQNFDFRFVHRLSCSFTWYSRLVLFTRCGSSKIQRNLIIWLAVVNQSIFCMAHHVKGHETPRTYKVSKFCWHFVEADWHIERSFKAPSLLCLIRFSRAYFKKDYSREIIKERWTLELSFRDILM